MILLCCLVRCHLINRRNKIDRLDREILTGEANRIMGNFKEDQEKKNKKAKEKALKAWKKKHPHLPIEDFENSIFDDDSNVNSSTYGGGYINNSTIRDSSYDYR